MDGSVSSRWSPSLIKVSKNMKLFDLKIASCNTAQWHEKELDSVCSKCSRSSSGVLCSLNLLAVGLLCVTLGTNGLIF